MAIRKTFPTSNVPLGSKHGFFKTLPRELRDSIYNLLYQEVEIQRDNFSLRVNIPCVALRLVNRHFKLEYDESCSANGHASHQLLIKDSEDFRFLMHTWLEFPAITRHAADVTVVVNACNDAGRSKHVSNRYPCRVYYIEYYREWIDHLVKQLPSLRSVRIYLTIVKEKCVYKVLPTLRSIAKPPQVIELNLLHPGCKFEATEDNRLLAKWTRERGEERDEEAVSEYLERAFHGG